MSKQESSSPSSAQQQPAPTNVAEMLEALATQPQPKEGSGAMLQQARLSTCSSKGKEEGLLDPD